MSTISWGFPNPGQITTEELGGLFQYKEMIITSDMLKNPPSNNGPYNDGYMLLPPVANKYCKWNMDILFIPGNVPFGSKGDMNLTNGSFVYFPINFMYITENKPLAYQHTSYFGINYDSNRISPQNYSGESLLLLENIQGTITEGNGYLKIKIWYQLIDIA